MNTRLWLEPWSDPCLKSTEQQSQQAMGAEIASYGECQQAALLRIKALFVWQSWSPLYSSGLGLSSTLFWTLCWTQQISLISPAFQVNIIPPLQSKAHILICALYLNHTHSNTLPHSVIFILFYASHRPCWLTFSTQMRVVPTHGVANAWDVIRIKDIDHTGPDGGGINNS